MSMTRLELFCNLGYKTDPLSTAWIETGDQARIRRILVMGVESRAMISIVGPPGIGKSETVEKTLAGIGATIVTVEKADKSRVSIGDIEVAMILDLSDEKPLGGEKQGRQLRPILGAATTGRKKVVLVLEEAQRLHAATLKSLKTLREKRWMGEKELFTVVLISQSDPMARPGLSEVRLRTDCVHMRGLSATEAGNYIRGTVGKHFEESAIDALAELPAASNFLELQELLVTVLIHVKSANRDMVTAEDVLEIAAEKQMVAPSPNTPAKAPKAPTAPKSGQSALKEVLLSRTGGAAQADREAINA